MKDYLTKLVILLILLPVIYIISVGMGLVTTVVFDMDTHQGCNYNSKANLWGWCFLLGWLTEVALLVIVGTVATAVAMCIRT